MAQFKMVNITIDMFDNRKIKHLRKLPEGNSIVLIWVMLLTMAGRCDAGGMIFLTKNIFYTSKMLADELGFDESTIDLALKAFEQLEMITTENDALQIVGWEEYQDDKTRGDSYMGKKEYNRLAQQRSRERKKLSGNVNDTDLTCQEDVNDMSMTCQNECLTKEREENKEERSKEENREDKEIYNINNSNLEKKEKISPYGDKKERKAEGKNIPPSLEEVQEYCKKQGYTATQPENFMAYYGSNGWKVGKNKMVSWTQALTGWEIRERQKRGMPKLSQAREKPPQNEPLVEYPIGSGNMMPRSRAERLIRSFELVKYPPSSGNYMPPWRAEELRAKEKK